MSSSASHKVYEFKGFRFDADALVLYHGEQIVRDAEKKSLAVLGAMLSNGTEVTNYDEIIQTVWGDASYGILPARVNQYISRLQKLFAEFEPDTTFIENLRGRGYRFICPFSANTLETTTTPSLDPPAALVEPSREPTAANKRVKWPLWLLPAALVLILTFVGFAAWRGLTRKDDTEVKRVVQEAQLYESLTLYRHPADFRDEDLDRFWLPDSDPNVNYDRTRIKDLAYKLVADGRHYGEESKCDLFEFQSVDIGTDGSTAIVKTLEKWFVTVYLNDGTLQKNKYIGPYFVSYLLRRTDGRWLIEKSTTARMNRPVPRLADLTAETDPKPGHEFLIKIIGQDLEPATISLEVAGPGCPAGRPCKIPNSALLERSNLSDTALDRIPLTLASGNFTIIARNGDSQPSNPVFLRVP